MSRPIRFYNTSGWSEVSKNSSLGVGSYTVYTLLRSWFAKAGIKLLVKGVPTAETFLCNTTSSLDGMLMRYVLLCLSGKTPWLYTKTKNSFILQHQEALRVRELTPGADGKGGIHFLGNYQGWQLPPATGLRSALANTPFQPVTISHQVHTEDLWNVHGIVCIQFHPETKSVPEATQTIQRNILFFDSDGFPRSLLAAGIGWVETGDSKSVVPPEKGWFLHASCFPEELRKVFSWFPPKVPADLPLSRTSQLLQEAKRLFEKTPSDTPLGRVLSKSLSLV